MRQPVIRDAIDDTGRVGTEEVVDDSLSRLLLDPEHFLIVERNHAFVQTAHPGRGGPGPAYVEGFQIEYKLRPDDVQWLSFTDDHHRVVSAVQGFAADQPDWSDGFEWQPLDLNDVGQAHANAQTMVKEFGDELQTRPGLESFRFYRSRLELSRRDGDLTHIIRFHGRRRGTALTVEMHALVLSTRLRDWQEVRHRRQGENSGRIALCYVGYLMPSHTSSYPGIELRYSRETALWVVPNLINRFVIPFFDQFNPTRDFIRGLPDVHFKLLSPADVIELLICDGDSSALRAYCDRWRTNSPATYNIFTRRLDAVSAGTDDRGSGRPARAADLVHEASLVSVVPR